MVIKTSYINILQLQQRQGPPAKRLGLSPLVPVDPTPLHCDNESRSWTWWSMAGSFQVY